MANKEIFFRIIEGPQDEENKQETESKEEQKIEIK